LKNPISEGTNPPDPEGTDPALEVKNPIPEETDPPDPELRNLIWEDIDPPGLEKKNLGSLFSTIGRIFARVKGDAEKAFRAHFPFLADPVALSRHAKALGIPKFPEDPEKFRNRVSAASFFLAQVGERSYILEQLEDRLGKRYGTAEELRRGSDDGFFLDEQFLEVRIELPESGRKHREWVRSFLDGLLNPNIFLGFPQWFSFREDDDAMDMDDDLRVGAVRKDSDSFAGDFICDGRFLCNQGSHALCDGSWPCDGSVVPGFVPGRGAVLPTAAFVDSFTCRILPKSGPDAGKRMYEEVI